VGVRVYGVPRTGVRIRVPLAVIPEDKIRFLKEFSFSSVMRVDRFEDFSFEELINVARGVIDRLPSVRSGTEKLFVNEIIDRSGLLLQTSLALTSLQEEYIFAHRSVQEFLAARRLLGDPQAGAWLLLERVHHPEWRLITLFFASFEHDHVETLLRGLRPRQLELCGRCLAVANTSDHELASGIIYDLCERMSLELRSDQAQATFGSLIGLTNSVMPWIRDEAVAAVVDRMDQFGSSVDEFFSLDQDSVSRLMIALAELDGPQPVLLMGFLADCQAHNPSQILHPFWIMLERISAMSSQANIFAGKNIVVRSLFDLCKTREWLHELQTQPLLSRPAQASFDSYPFHAALPRSFEPASTYR
jgi:hypothetical protein